MKPLPGFAVALAVSLVAGLCCTLGQAPPTPQPPRASSAPGTPSVPAQPVSRITFDLAKAQPGSTTTLDVPRGTHTVIATHRAAMVDYRASAPTPGVPSAVPPTTWGLHPFRPEPDSAPPAAECRSLSAAFSALIKEGEESAIPGRLEALRRTQAGAACEKERSQAGFAPHLVEGRIGPLVVPVGGSVSVTIERLDQAGATAQSWTVVLRGPLREEAWARANETEWLVAEVLGDVGRLIDFAKAGKLGPAGVELQANDGPEALATFVVRRQGEGWRPSERTLAIRTHVWSPEDYRPLVQAWLGDAGLRGARGGDVPSILETLADLRPAVLRREASRLSDLLAARPLDPRVHEQAAFLLGASAWREKASYFDDARPALCGMSAHLSMAAALRGKDSPSAEGLLAGAMLELLAERATPAKARLADLEKRLAEPPARAWLHALGLRLENDWRRLAKPLDNTLLQRVELTRALERVAGQSAALDFLDKHPPGPEADWARVLQPWSVESGNVYATKGVDREIDEARAFLEIPAGDLGSISRAVAEAAASPSGRLGPGPRPQVASRSFWAAGVQRSLLAMVWAERNHLQKMLGLPEKAAARWSELSPLLQPLPLFGVNQVGWADKDRLPEACRLAQDALLARRPELVAASAWGLAYRRCSDLRAEGGLTLPSAWFASGPPPGTAFDHVPRLDIPEIEARLSPADLERLKALKPRSWPILKTYAKRVRARDLSAADVREAYGDGADGDRSALFGLLELKPDDRERVRILSRLCEVDGLYCLTLGEELTSTDPPAAAKAYQRGIATCRDRVGVSNSTGWLADYYLDHGQEREALELAELSADVYSARGLHTQARVFERLGRLAEAEEVYRTAQERYDDEALDAFHIRQARRAPRGPYADAGRKALERIFPQGLKTTSLEKLTVLDNPRRADVFFLDRGWITRRYERLGAKLGDIVRTVDDTEVSSEGQYFCARSFSDNPELSLVVQRGHTLLALRGAFPREKFGPVPARAK